MGLETRGQSALVLLKTKGWNYPCFQCVFGRKRSWGTKRTYKYIFSGGNVSMGKTVKILIFWGAKMQFVKKIIKKSLVKSGMGLPGTWSESCYSLHYFNIRIKLTYLWCELIIFNNRKSPIGIHIISVLRSRMDWNRFLISFYFLFYCIL